MRNARREVSTGWWMDPHEQSGTHPGTMAWQQGWRENKKMQKDYGDRRLAHVEWKQACDVCIKTKVTKGAGWGGWLADEDGFA